MELNLAFSTTSTLLLIITFFFLRSLIKINKKSKDNNLPPGPWKLPIIGNLHQLATGDLPQDILTKLSKKYGPLMHLQLGEISTVVVSSPNMAKAFLKTHDLAFGKRHSNLVTDMLSYDGAGIGFGPIGDNWRQMKKICVTELLSNARVESISSIRKNEVSNLVAFIAGSVGSPIDLGHQFFSISSTVTSKAVFGEKFPDHSTIISHVSEATELIGGFNLGDFFPSYSFISVVTGIKRNMQRVQKKIDVSMNDIIKQRREYNEEVRKQSEGKNNKEDLLDALLRHQKEKDSPITDTIIKAVILDLFFAGTEAVAAVIEWAMCELIKNPKVMEKAQSEARLSLSKSKNAEEADKHKLPYLQLVIKETLRLHPPGPLLIPRESTEPFEINGYTIPVKSNTLINVGWIARDPELWEDAEKFFPERFEKNKFDYSGNNFEFLPFGSGRRICPGASFGLAIAEVVLSQLLYHFNWKLPNGTKPGDMVMTKATGLTGKMRNPLVLIPEYYEAALF